MLSLSTGLFGFTEVRTTAGIVTGVIDVGAFAVLAALALAPVRADAAAKALEGHAADIPTGFPARISPAITRAGATTAAALAVVALVLLGLPSLGPVLPRRPSRARA
jgi:hypothetical protein